MPHLTTNRAVKFKVRRHLFGTTCHFFSFLSVRWEFFDCHFLLNIKILPKNEPKLPILVSNCNYKLFDTPPQVEGKV
jgi:hypothetical protein